MIEIKPLAHCDAVVTIPGSKSYTHRALIVAALAGGESVLLNALRCEDTEYTARGLEEFGVLVQEGKDSFRVQGTGGLLPGRGEKIDVGNSGTSMRFLSALAALKKGRTILDGSERMKKRPMAGLLEGLAALGVQARSQEGNGCPPVIVESQGLPGGIARIDGSESSQFLSALLMIAPYAEKDMGLEVTGSLASKPYIDITREVMQSFGVKVQSQGDRFFSVRAGQRYLPRGYRVEGDASNASYFFAAAAITRGTVRVENFRPDSVQGDAGFLGILEKMGCEVVRGNEWAEVCGKDLRGIDIDMNTMPDLVPTLAVTAIHTSGKTVIRNVGHLRVKESDRIGDLVRELSKLGVRAEEGKDWLAVEGGNIHGGDIDPHNDHRLAMSFAIAGLRTPGVRIQGERCVDKSFPGFWETLEQLYKKKGSRVQGF